MMVECALYSVLVPISALPINNILYSMYCRSVNLCELHNCKSLIVYIIICTPYIYLGDDVIKITYKRQNVLY